MGETAGISSSSILAISSLSQAGTTLATSYAQYGAIKAQGEFQKQQYDLNSRLAGMQAKDAIERGYKTAGKVRKDVKRTIGAQRAALAAQGIDIGVGSALDIQHDTERLGELDAIAIKTNAWQEAWGYKMQALNYSGQGSFAASTAAFQARNTLLAGGMNTLTYGLQGAYYYSGGKKVA